MSKQIPDLRDYQIVDLAFYNMADRVGNFSDPGTGKTPPTCVYSWQRWTENQAKSIWVQPKSLMRKNQQEMIRFTPFTSEDVVVVDGTPAQKRRQVALESRVMVMTAESLKTYGPDLPLDYQLVVTDEHHMIYGSHGSQRTQALYQFMKPRKWFVAMTGTMINGRLDTCYPWVHLVEPLYYMSHDQFMSFHAWKDDYGNIIGWQNHEKLRAIFGHHAIRRTFEEVYGPEAKVIETEGVEMTPIQRAKYDEFKDNAILELESGWLDGSLPGVNLIRCRQIMGHPWAIPTPEGGYEDITGGELGGKIERIKIHLEDHKRTGKPLVIYSWLVRTQEKIREAVEAAGIPVGFINGSVSGAQRARVDEAFRSGDLRCVVASQATAGVGFNWQVCGGVEVEHVIYESLDYLDGSLMQSYRRMLRGERSSPLRITILEYENSLDQLVFRIVQRKSEMANKVDSSREIYQLSA